MVTVEDLFHHIPAAISTPAATSLCPPMYLVADCSFISYPGQWAVEQRRTITVVANGNNAFCPEASSAQPPVDPVKTESQLLGDSR